MVLVLDRKSLEDGQILGCGSFRAGNDGNVISRDAKCVAEGHLTHLTSDILKLLSGFKVLLSMYIFVC